MYSTLRPTVQHSCLTICPSSTRAILSHIKDSTDCSSFDVINLRMTAILPHEPHKDMDFHVRYKGSIPLINQILLTCNPTVLTIVTRLRTKTLTLAEDDIQSMASGVNYTVRWNIAQSSSPSPAVYPWAIVIFVVKNTFHTRIPISSSEQAALSFNISEYIFPPLITGCDVPVHPSTLSAIIGFMCHFLHIHLNLLTVYTHFIAHIYVKTV